MPTPLAIGVYHWRARLSDVPSAAPISYAVDGRQYVAVVVGYGDGEPERATSRSLREQA